MRSPCGCHIISRPPPTTSEACFVELNVAEPQADCQNYLKAGRVAGSIAYLAAHCLSQGNRVATFARIAWPDPVQGVARQSKRPPGHTRGRPFDHLTLKAQALARCGISIGAQGFVLRRAMNAARRSPRSHGIRVLQAAASANSDFIQRRSVFISVPSLQSGPAWALTAKCAAQSGGSWAVLRRVRGILQTSRRGLCCCLQFQSGLNTHSARRQGRMLRAGLPRSGGHNRPRGYGCCADS